MEIERFLVAPSVYGSYVLDTNENEIEDKSVGAIVWIEDDHIWFCITLILEVPGTSWLKSANILPVETPNNCLYNSSNIASFAVWVVKTDIY